MQNLLLVVHLVVAVSLIGLVLLQKGKGAEIGASFGSGASQTVFGSQGSASFLTRASAVLAALFFITSLTLAYFNNGKLSQTNSLGIEIPASVLPPVNDNTVPADVPGLEIPSEN